MVLVVDRKLLNYIQVEHKTKCDTEQNFQQKKKKEDYLVKP